ncbi:MAG: class 1 isoprenoid biosynthesis enzyme [Anaerolineae bacterium]|nr:class 1 isoprenoid biosynthesis enzyme [Anaerolineae bacterium]
MQSFFPKHIQREIDVARVTLSRLQVDWPGSLTVNRRDRATIHEGYPYLFLDAFPSLTPSDVQPLALSGWLLAGSVVVYDDVLDRYSSHILTNALRAQAAQFEAYQILHQIFPPDAAFWRRFRSYMRAYASACTQEYAFTSGARPWHKYTEPLAFEIAIGKTGIAKAAIAGLAELAQDDTLLTSLSEAVEHYYIACQMWDDLCDWKEDLQAGIPSLLLARMLSERPTRENCTKTVPQMARQLYYDGHAQYVLDLALDALDRADSLTAGIPNLLWRHATADLRLHCEQLLHDIKQIVRKNLRRAHEKSRISGIVA